MKTEIITRTVLTLSLVSLFTDTASEMLYPVMPLYLRDIGFSIVGIGILEGLAEAIAGLSKGYFGNRSDISGKRLPFVQVGYSLSALSKPMMAVFIFPWWIFFARSIDRLGKGIRTGARDALLSEEATPQTKGTVFGFHRSMDTLGAAMGPALALVFLYFYPQQYKALFYLAFIPGVLAIISTFLLKEKKKESLAGVKGFSFLQFLRYWQQSNVEYKKLVSALLVFALVNSSDVFLLLKMKASGISDTWLIGVYIFYNGVYALTAYPVGMLADKIGLKKMLIVGLILFATVYTSIAAINTLLGYLVIFFVYGLYAAASEGVAKAWISNIVTAKETATAIGTYTGFQSLIALAASSIAGLLWFNFGPAYVFIPAGIIALLIALFIYSKIQKPVYA